MRIPAADFGSHFDWHILHFSMTTEKKARFLHWLSWFYTSYKKFRCCFSHVSEAIKALICKAGVMPAYIPGVRLPVPALGFMFPNALEQAHLGTSSLYIEDQALKMLPREHHRQFFLGKQEKSAPDRFLISGSDHTPSFTIAETPALSLADSHYLLYLSLAIVLRFQH